MKTAIVTGAGGFVGRALCKKLLGQDYFVHGIDIALASMFELNDNTNFAAVQADFSCYPNLKDLISVRCPDVFFHLAWDGTFGKSFEDYHKQMNNACACADALMVAKDLEAKRFVLITTIVELETLHCAQNGFQQLRVSNIYGVAKLAADTICRVLAQDKNLEMCTAILSSVYGPGDRSAMIQNVLIRNLLQGKSPDLIMGNNLYDWVYIDDAADGIIAIGERGQNKGSYYVGHRQPVTFKKLVSDTRDILCPGLELRFGIYPDGTPIDFSLVDLDKLYLDIGFEARFDFCESIQKTAEWLKEEESMCMAKPKNTLTGGGGV